jgi:hypothetical protein
MNCSCFVGSRRCPQLGRLVGPCQMAADVRAKTAKLATRQAWCLWSYEEPMWQFRRQCCNSDHSDLGTGNAASTRPFLGKAIWSGLDMAHTEPGTAPVAVVLFHSSCSDSFGDLFEISDGDAINWHDSWCECLCWKCASRVWGAGSGSVGIGLKSKWKMMNIG